ncbi:mechanosensitive ion channel family protein [Sulfurimonas sp.]|uniref:mechanosensitive ion channel family protein n=1 Tax=Sulfurimonas sp. TaxID=2022749 RepID=UPI003563318F
MRLFFILLILNITLFSATIDTKLFEDANKDVYYDEVKKKIAIDANKGVRSEESIKNELIHLARLQDAASQKVQIDKYDLSALQNIVVSINDYHDAVHSAANVEYKLIQNSKIVNDIQSKLLFLKQALERITENEKPMVLSYQLQFAYYKLQQRNIEAKSLLLKTHKNEIIKSLVNALSSLKCFTKETFTKKLASYDREMEEALKEKISQQLQHEKALIEDNTKIETIAKKIEIAHAKYQKILTQKIEVQIQHSLCMLKKKENVDFYNTTSKIESLIDNITTTKEKEIYLEQINILKAISKIEFGSTKLFLISTLQESKEAFLSFKEFLTSSLFIFNERAISLWSLFKALVLIILGFILGSVYKRWIARISKRWSRLSMMSIRLASNIGYYLVVFIFFIIAISSLGIDMTSISLIAGALSIGIGFGLQTVVSNLIAGVILMFERTIRIGDTIEINDLLHGTVTDMRIRSTTIKTFDNIDIIIPNSSFIQNNVINWTLEDRVRRLHIPFSVAYDTEVEDVKEAVLGALKKSTLFYVRNNDERKPDIRMTMMNNSSVDFELIVWVEWDMRQKNMSTKSDFLILIYNALREHNIKIPFPQLDVSIKHPQDNV